MRQAREVKDSWEENKEKMMTKGDVQGRQGEEGSEDGENRKNERRNKSPAIFIS